MHFPLYSCLAHSCALCTHCFVAASIVHVLLEHSFVAQKGAFFTPKAPPGILLRSFWLHRNSFIKL